MLKTEPTEDLIHKDYINIINDKIPNKIRILLKKKNFKKVGSLDIS